MGSNPNDQMAQMRAAQLNNYAAPKTPSGISILSPVAPKANPVTPVPPAGSMLQGPRAPKANPVTVTKRPF